MDIRVIKTKNKPILPPKPRSRSRFFKIPLFVIAVFLLLSAVVYAYTSIFNKEEEKIAMLGDGLDRAGIAAVLGETLGWNDKEQKEFAAAYGEIQWMEFSAELPAVFSEEFGWGAPEQEAFLTQSTKYADPHFDFLSRVYAPGSYTVSSDASFAEIADALSVRAKEYAGENLSGFLKERLDREKMASVNALVKSEAEFLPDLVPLPPADLRIDKTGPDAILMSFSTIYYNKGKGSLELIADPNKKGIRSDHERDVYQRIERKDGTTRSKVVGNFLWHQQHLHYHYSDFITYDLEVIDAPGSPDLSGVRMKSTFCIRDVSRIDLELERRAPDAKYKICGKEIQGISVGWGDTYFFSYPDQNLNIVEIPSGRYRLSFNVNPTRMLDEMDYSNNRSSVVLDINMENLTVKIVEEEPREYPKVEHVYPDQVFE